MPVVLTNDHLRTVIDPDQGTSLYSFQTCRDGTWLSLMPDVDDPSCDLAAASFLMVPYSNRIADGAFTFAGQNYKLQNAANHAIHGDVRERPWTITQHDIDRLVCTFDSGDYEDVNWPWAFAVRAEYELNGPTLRQRLVIKNRADRPMPAGCGWHPFFNRAPTTVDAAVHLEFQVAGAYPDGYGNRIPSGRTESLADHQDFHTVKPLAIDNFLDTCFNGYDGGGHIAWPASGIRIRFACSAACTHLVLYNPKGKPYFAVEPVTNANDGVNLHARGDQTSGITVLEPGQDLETSFEMQVEFD